MTKSTRLAERLAAPVLISFFLFISTFTLGISLGDDSFYLQGGRSVSFSNFLYFQYWAPLYHLWFRLLTFVSPNPIHRYFLSWALLVIITTLLPSAMRIRSAWPYSFAVICLPLFTIIPFVSLFCSAILLFGMCVMLRLNWPIPQALAASCLVCFVAAFTRPEFNYGVFAAALATLGALLLDRLRGRHGSERSATPAATVRLALAVIGLAALMLVPMTHSRLSRSGMAFAQHYNIRAAERGEFHGSPDAWRSDFVEKAFGIDTGQNAATGTATIGEFFRANPRLFLLHIWYNLVDPRTLFLAFVLLLVLLRPWFREDARHLRPASLFLFFIIFPPLTSIFVIYPSDHFASVLVPAAVLYALQLLQLDRWIRPSLPWLLVSGCVLIWFFNMGLPKLRDAPPSGDRTSLRRIQCVYAADQSAPPANPLVFDTAFINDIYFAHPRWIVVPSQLPSWVQFQGWTSSARPAWISTDAALAASYKVTPRQLDAFLAHDLGYIAHPCAAQAQLTLYINPGRHP